MDARSTMPADWDPDFAARSPMFEPLRAAAGRLRTPCWPGCDDLNRVLSSRGTAIVTAGGHALRFVGQARRRLAFEDRFEPRIYLRGEVQFRPCNWHDLFNALAWMTFPAAKAALNQRHYRELVQARASGASNRGPVQDALTLFDEGGVIIASADRGLDALLDGFRWKDLFWRRRIDVMRSMRFFLIGHALYEKALAPFEGVTGRAVIFGVEETFLDLPLGAQLRTIDLRLADRLADTGQFTVTRQLLPLPILGVPGWSAQNSREQYYDNARYFRSRP